MQATIATVITGLLLLQIFHNRLGRRQFNRNSERNRKVESSTDSIMTSWMRLLWTLRNGLSVLLRRLFECHTVADMHFWFVVIFLQFKSKFNYSQYSSPFSASPIPTHRIVEINFIGDDVIFTGRQIYEFHLTKFQENRIAQHISFPPGHPVGRVNRS